MAELTKSELQAELANRNSELMTKNAEIEAMHAELDVLRTVKEADDERENIGSALVDPENDPKRMVKIKLFRDNNRYKEPLFVSVNNYTALIQRGVQVEVPYFVKRHIEEMNAQDEATAMLVEGLVKEYGEKSR